MIGDLWRRMGPHGKTITTIVTPITAVVIVAILPKNVQIAILCLFVLGCIVTAAVLIYSVIYDRYANPWTPLDERTIYEHADKPDRV